MIFDIFEYKWADDETNEWMMLFVWQQQWREQMTKFTT